MATVPRAIAEIWKQSSNLGGDEQAFDDGPRIVAPPKVVPKAPKRVAPPVRGINNNKPDDPTKLIEPHQYLEILKSIKEAKEKAYFDSLKRTQEAKDVSLGEDVDNDSKLILSSRLRALAELTHKLLQANVAQLDKEKFKEYRHRMRILSEESCIYMYELWDLCKRMILQAYQLTSINVMMGNRVMGGVNMMQIKELGQLLHRQDLDKVIYICQLCLDLHNLHTKTMTKTLKVGARNDQNIPMPESGCTYIDSTCITTEVSISRNSALTSTTPTSELCVDLFFLDGLMFEALWNGQVMSWVARTFFNKYEVEVKKQSNYGFVWPSLTLFMEGKSVLDERLHRKLRYVYDKPSLRDQRRGQVEPCKTQSIKYKNVTRNMLDFALSLDVRWIIVLIIWQAERMYPEMSRYLGNLLKYAHATLLHHEYILANIRPMLVKECSGEELRILMRDYFRTLSAKDAEALLPSNTQLPTRHTPCLEYLFEVARVHKDSSYIARLSDDTVAWSKAWKQMWTADPQKWGEHLNVLQQQCLRELGVLCMLPTLSLEKIEGFNYQIMDKVDDGTPAGTHNFWGDVTYGAIHPLNGALCFERDKLRTAITETIPHDPVFHTIFDEVFSMDRRDDLYDFNPYDFFRTTFDVPPLLRYFFKGDNQNNIDVIRRS